MSKAKRNEQKNRRAAFVATIADEAGSYWLTEADGCERGYKRDGSLIGGTVSEFHEPGSHVF
jgi:hypothetical protein